MICWYYSQYSDIAIAVKFFVVQYLFFVFMLINVLEKLLLRIHSCYLFILSISYIMFMKGFCT